jgi:hypothetical protein
VGIEFAVFGNLSAPIKEGSFKSFL